MECELCDALIPIYSLTVSGSAFAYRIIEEASIRYSTAK